MSSSSSSSKQMLDVLSEIAPLAFYSPTPAQAIIPPPPSPPQNTPDNPFFSIDLNNSTVPGTCEDMLPDNMFEGDLLLEAKSITWGSTFPILIYFSQIDPCSEPW